MSSATSSSSGTTTPDYRATLAARLRGQTIIVPDVLRTIYNCPTVRLNDTELLTQYLDVWLEKYVPNASQRAKQAKVNTPLISSYFWSRVPKDKFKVLGCVNAWFFFWDDEIDCGSLQFDKGTRTEEYCDNAIAFIRSCMQPERNLPRPAPGSFHNSDSFVDIAIAMQDGQSRADRDRLIPRRTAKWQVGLDSVQEFIDRRMETIGVVPTLLTNVWGYGIKLPEWVWDHESVQVMMREVARGVMLYNDIASLKKELKAGDVDNIIPLFVYHRNISAQEAVDMAVKSLEESFGTYTAAVERLRHTVNAESEDVKRDVEVWVDACVDMRIGNVAWSLATPRYLPRSAFSDGSSGFEITL